MKAPSVRARTARSTAATAPPGGLPLQPTSFIGRERELAEVARLIDTTRLLTLTGAGGCGKTRLALRAAADLAHAYAGGVRLVELAALADATLVPRAVAAAFDLPETTALPVPEALAAWLGDTPVLLVLDNCEHLVTAAAELVDALLRRCAGLRVLATSREALGCAGETILRVPSLALPPAGGPLDPEHALRYEAVRLFCERARAARPDFRLTAESAPAVAEICRRLDGIPLALELAAARVKILSVAQIAARLDDRFALLTVGPRTAMPRQQTLRATVDWSHHMLSEPERALLRRLSVFAGGWTVETAEAVCAGGGIAAHALLDLLAQLVEKSLVLAEEQRGTVRFRMLETIREYARARLVEAGEDDVTRDRHLAAFLRLAEAAEPRLRTAEAGPAVEQLEAEHDNLRAALEWSLAPGRSTEAALRLSGALAWFWWLRSYHDEGRHWPARALAAPAERSAARMKALHGAGWLAHHRRESAAARENLRESLAIAVELGDRWTEAWALHVLGRVAYFDGDPAAARAFGERSLAVAEDLGDDWLIAWALHLLGLAAYIAADDATARAYYARSLAIRRQLGYREGIAILLHLLGLVALRGGDLPEALARFREALPMIAAVQGPWGVTMPLVGFAAVAAASGQPGRAARLGAVAAALVETYRTPMIPLVEPFLAEAMERAGQALGGSAHAGAVAEGQAMSLDAAIAEAFAVDLGPRAASTPAEGEPFAGLTATELQVLRLVSTGRTTKEIAAELVVAVSTVDRHLTHIYQKLGVRNRAGAVGFALQHGLA